MGDKQYPRNFLRSAQDASLAYMSNRNHRDSCNNPRSVTVTGEALLFKEWAVAAICRDGASSGQ